MAVQWLQLCTSTAGGAGLIPGWGTKIPHAVWQKNIFLKNVAFQPTTNTIFCRESQMNDLILTHKNQQVPYGI